jgi:hypothetical protein
MLKTGGSPMATLRETYTRNTAAAELIRLEGEATSSINRLVAVKANILSLRAQIASGTAETTAADLAEVDGVLGQLGSRVRTDVLGI